MSREHPVFKKTLLEMRREEARVKFLLVHYRGDAALQWRLNVIQNTKRNWWECASTARRTGGRVALRMVSEMQDG